MSSDDFIDVQQRIATFSVEELSATAEEYFQRLENWDYLLAKPLAQVSEAPELLQCFAHIVQGLQLVPGMTVVDFGAGACWTSRFLSQLGMEVIALDVSESALRIGQQLYQRNPIVGEQPPPRFLKFDGHRIPLPDCSVDRIACWEAFHHVPNQAEVLKEIARVLKPAGIAGFSEPGPTHSRGAQSQAEMRNHRVIENDIVVEDIWERARKAGFVDMRLALFTARAPMVGLEEFSRFSEGENDQVLRHVAAELRAYLPGRRLFFLLKEGTPEIADSRRREGLAATLGVQLTAAAFPAALRAKVKVHNAGTSTWLGKSARIGAVHVGVHLYDVHGTLITHGYHIHYGLAGIDPERPILSGEVREFEFDLPAPTSGDYVLEFDLVSSGVCWFAHCGSTPVRISWSVPRT